MARTKDKLTFQQIKAFKWEGKDRKEFDGGGLYLHIKENGKFWRLKYSYDKKEKLLSFGEYKTCTLAEARDKRDEAKKLLQQGIDPALHKKIAIENNLESFSNTFELIAREWWHTEHIKNVVPDHAEKNMRRLETYIFPFIGKLPVSMITSRQILDCLEKIEKKGYNETAHRVKYLCEAVYNFAIIHGKTQYNIVSPLKKALSPVKVKHYAAITKSEDFAKLLKSIDNYFGSPVVAAALKLSPLVFVRPGELRTAKWEQINFKTKTWEYIAFKVNEPHIVPLSHQALEIIEQLKLYAGRSEYLFPSERTFLKPISNNTVNAALRGLGYSKEQVTAHGFRASARTILAEILEIDEKYIEKQLAHRVKDPNGNAYNRTAFISRRTEMMQRWADYLDELKVTQ